MTFQPPAYSKSASNAKKREGFYVAEVTRVEDPNVYVKVEQLTQNFEHGPIIYVGALPQVGDKIVVSFLHGDQDVLAAIIPGGGAAGDGPTIEPSVLVASSTASQAIKDRADYVCDGVADDVQIMAAMAVAKDGIVQLTEGQFVLDAPLWFGNSYSTWLKGVGEGTSLYPRWDCENGGTWGLNQTYMVSFGAPGQQLSDLRIDITNGRTDIGVRNTRQTFVVYANTGGQTYLRDVVFHGMVDVDGDYAGIRLHYVHGWDIVVDQCEFYDLVGDPVGSSYAVNTAIYSNGGLVCRDSVFQGRYIDVAGDHLQAIFLDGGVDELIESSYFLETVVVAQGAAYRESLSTIRNNIFEGFQNDALNGFIVIDGAERLMIEKNQFYGSDVKWTNQTAPLIRIQSGTHIHIVDNDIFGGEIWLGDATSAKLINSTIVRNRFNDSHTIKAIPNATSSLNVATLENVLIEGNHIDAEEWGSDVAIGMGPLTTAPGKIVVNNLQITNNTIIANYGNFGSDQVPAIYLEGDLTKVSITNNYIYHYRDRFGIWVKNTNTTNDDIRALQVVDNVIWNTHGIYVQNMEQTQIVGNHLPLNNWTLTLYTGQVANQIIVYGPQSEYTQINNNFIMLGTAGDQQGAGAIIYATANTGGTVVGNTIYGHKQGETLEIGIRVDGPDFYVGSNTYQGFGPGVLGSGQTLLSSLVQPANSGTGHTYGANNGHQVGTAAHIMDSFESFFDYDGTIDTATGVFKLPFRQDSFIESVYVTVGTAPTGSSIILDVNKNGSTVFTTQANRPTIPTGANASNVAVPNTLQQTFSAGDVLTVDIDQKGSATPGADLVLVVRWRLK